jgi:hypothetical protein
VIPDEARKAAIEAGRRAHDKWSDAPNRDAYVPYWMAAAAVEGALAAAPLIAARALEGEPTSERQSAAEEAIAAAWPHLADDPVHVEQLAAVALNAAYNPSWRAGLLSVLAPEAGRERSHAEQAAGGRRCYCAACSAKRGVTS